MLLSDDPGWYRRAEHRRAFCRNDAPWIVVAECGAPSEISELSILLDSELPKRIWTGGVIAANNYLRATGLAQDPSWVFGNGPRAIWPDHPGRWFVAHASTEAITSAARNHLAGAPAPAEPKLGHTYLNGMATQIVHRGKGEPAATQGDVLKAAIAMIGIDPSQCFGAGPFSPPVMMRVGESYPVATIDDGGLVIASHLEWTGWQDEFRRRQPFTVAPDTDLVGPAGPIRVVRLRWNVLFERAAAGDASVPQSPAELAVSFAEVVGVHPGNCWGIAERQPGSELGSAYAQVVYRPTTDDDDGRSRFTAYLASLGLTSADVAVGHPEGYIAVDRARRHHDPALPGPVSAGPRRWRLPTAGYGIPVAVARRGLVSIDCAEPVVLAEFWAAMLGGETVALNATTIIVMSDWLWLAALEVDDYRPPTWPSSEIPKQIHLDLDVPDLDAAAAEAVALGAVVAPDQPDPNRWRVLFDPAGHPFCLTTQATE